MYRNALHCTGNCECVCVRAREDVCDYVFPPSIHLSSRTTSHPSLVVKHCSLTSLIRRQLNHLSVCLSAPSPPLIRSSPHLSAYMYLLPRSHPHVKQVPCSSLPSPLCSLSLIILVCEERASTMELITAIQWPYLCLFTARRRPGTQPSHLHTATRLTRTHTRTQA